MEGEGDWPMPSSPCSVEATPEAEVEKKEDHGTSLARKCLEYTSSRARPLAWAIGPKVKPSWHRASPRQPILGEAEGNASWSLKVEEKRRAGERALTARSCNESTVIIMSREAGEPVDSCTASPSPTTSTSGDSL